MNYDRKQYVFLLMAIALLLAGPVQAIKAAAYGDDDALARTLAIQNGILADIQALNESPGLVDSQLSHVFLTLPSPPAEALPHTLNGLFGKSATVWFWNAGEILYIHVQPSTDYFWLCGPSFTVLQDNTQYEDIKIQTEGGDSFCEELYAAQTFYFTQWSFVDVRFNPLQPMRIVFDGGSAGTQYIEYTPDDSATTSSTSSTTSVPVSTTTTTSPGRPCPVEAIYGEDSEEVTFLRMVRDHFLNQTPESRQLITLYYQWSPIIVKIMEGDKEFKQWVKEMIEDVLHLLEEVVD